MTAIVTRAMTSSRATPSSSAPATAFGDPWQALSYLISGPLFYGGVGWALDRWLATSWWMPLGIVIGAGLGMYMTYARFGRMEAVPQEQSEAGTDQ